MMVTILSLLTPKLSKNNYILNKKNHIYILKRINENYLLVEISDHSYNNLLGKWKIVKTYVRFGLILYKTLGDLTNQRKVLTLSLKYP